VITVLRPEVLDSMRRIGDPMLRLRAADKNRVGAAMPEGLVGMATAHPVGTPNIDDLVVAVGEQSVQERQATGINPDGDRLVIAQRLFAEYANEISGALLLAALPQAYAAGSGAAVLFASGGLGRDLRRRIRGTAQFLMVVTQPAPDARAAEQMWDPSVADAPDATTRVPPPWRMCAALRLYHHAIRRTVRTEVRPEADRPLNQEDLLGTLLTFTVTVFEVLERFGLAWTADEQDAYLHLWDVVGACIGIGSPEVMRNVHDVTGWRPPNGWQGLRPSDLDHTRYALEQIRERQWKSRVPGTIRESDWRGGRPGRLLVRALLDELTLAMPDRLCSWPVAVVRHLAPPPVRDRLSLGAPGVVMGVLETLPRRRATVGRFTAEEIANPVDATVTRMMANEVTRRAMVHFIQGGRFLIPGLEAWSAGFQEKRD
jgi:hypothetical protein